MDLNKWFLALPAGRQAVLIEDKWALAGAAWEAARRLEKDKALDICRELGEHWAGFKDTALLNGDVALSNAASGEPRAAAAIAAAIERA